MAQLFPSGVCADHRFQAPPFADERDRYLSHCAACGARPAALRVILHTRPTPIQEAAFKLLDLDPVRVQ